MLQAISSIVRNVAIIILITTFLEMLLPNNSMQRFIKVVMGLFIMLAILNPVINFLSNNQELELTAWQLSTPQVEKVDTVLAEGKKIINIQGKQALEEYKKRLERQIEALVKLIPEVGEVKCSLQVDSVNKIGSIGEITKANIWVSLHSKEHYGAIKSVKPVEVTIGENKSPELKPQETDFKVKEKILQFVTSYYGLKDSEVEIVFY